MYWEVEFEICNYGDHGGDKNHIIYGTGSLYVHASSIIDAIILAKDRAGRMCVEGTAVINACKLIPSSTVQSVSRGKSETNKTVWEEFQ